MSINKVILIGNAGKDPEIKEFQSGGKIASFSLATTERGWTAPNGTEVPERTEWHNIVLRKGLAEIAERYIHKGSKVYVEGKIRTRSYNDREGNKRYIVEICGDAVELLGSKTNASVSSEEETEDEAELSRKKEVMLEEMRLKEQRNASEFPLETEDEEMPF